MKRCLLILAALAAALPAHSQVVLSGAVQFSTNSVGAAAGGQIWNTLGSDSPWDLWLAQNPDGTSPINGPLDTNAGILIPLVVGHAHTFYIFGSSGCCTEPFNGLNLFFEGNTTTPAISVFEATNSNGFASNASSTLTLGGGAATGSGRAFFATGSVVAVLTGYSWNTPATPPGDVCQPKEFTPGGGPDYFGSFTLEVLPAASLTLSQESATPLTQITLSGSVFAPGENIDIFAGHLGVPSLLATAVADTNGSFSVNARLPQHPLGPIL